ncbi:Chaperone required for the assembly of the F1-ATPase [Cribrihabitans marinus]|uniref:Chaperone required for the assembly of the F1-ATPase n=1 Tax=Cribrihabitans marinus TaxID=1227549 RepID=A0A1H7DYA2_9RHOB|nr:ATP12 family protein [Cribrihabitans marinus]GGH40670.1 ATPase [Cribrihabitans marinus]SEK05787.1 Chaperone required for the assembly of the F1-ATPase [Cribrihabitans marinus]
MSDWKPKRFWKEATVVADADGHSVALDGRPVRTPAKALLVLPTRAMAEAVAAEWDAQGKVVDPESMPVTRSANAAIDKVRPQHAEVAEMLAAYGDSDLLCYRADHPDELVARQSAAWDPPLDWAETELSARLLPAAGVIHRPQDPRALAALGRRVHAMSPYHLAAFHDLVSMSGSLILGFAAALDWDRPEAIWQLSRLDELWQEEIWGVDDEARTLAERKGKAFMHAKRFYDLAG